MAHLLADLRYAFRTLRKSPVFTTVAVLSIALGIGANTAIFTLVDQALLRLLPVKNPQELVLVQANGPWRGSSWGDDRLSFPMYADFRDHNDAFTGMFCQFGYAMHVGFGGRTERVNAEIVSSSYFPVPGVYTVSGRTLGQDFPSDQKGFSCTFLRFGYWLCNYINTFTQ